MTTLSKKIELFIRASTESRKRTMPSLIVSIIISTKQIVAIDTFLKALLAFHCFTGCDSTGFFAGKGKLKPLSMLSSSEN